MMPPRKRVLAALAVCWPGLMLMPVGCGDSVDIVMASGSDSYPNTTASDWVTYADHVVVVTALSEQAVPPDEETEATGEGYLPRKVTLRVDDVVWSRADASHPAPEGSFEWNAWGWALRDGERVPMANEDQPRVEVGHAYIMALVWQPKFDDGYDYAPAHWGGLGSDSVLPYDDGVIGRGELAGSEVQSASPRAPSDPNFSLEDELAGKGVDELVAHLESATPGERLDYGPADT